MSRAGAVESASPASARSPCPSRCGSARSPWYRSGAERDEAVGGQPIGHLLDARVEPPPFLDHDHARPASHPRAVPDSRMRRRRCSEIRRVLPMRRTVDDACGLRAIPWGDDRPRAAGSPTPTRTIGRTCSTRGRPRAHSIRWSSPVRSARSSGTRAAPTWIDFTSQLVNMNLGHQHPKMVQAIKDQADRCAWSRRASPTSIAARRAG